MTGDEKRQIAGHTLAYTTSVYVAQLVGMVSGIAVRRFLEPAEMGLWVLLQTLLSYALLSECGILTSMYCRLPVHEAKGEKSEEERVRDVSFSFAFLAAAVAAAVLAAFAAAGWPGSSRTVRLGLVAAAAGTFATMGYNAFVSFLWAKRGFALLSRAVVLNALLQLGATFTLARAFGLKGLYVSMTVVPALTLAYVARGSGVRPRFAPDLRRAGALIRFGLPVFMTGLFYTLFLSLDRWLITRWLGAEALGHYSLALVAFSFSAIAPKMFSIVLFPRIQGEIARSGVSGRAVSMVLKPDRAIAMLSPLVLAAAYFFLPVLVRFFLERYEAGLGAARILLIGSFFLALAYNAQSFLIALGKRAHPIPFLAFAAALTVAAAWSLVRAGLGVGGVALAMSAGFFTYFLTLNVYTLRHALSSREVAVHLSEMASVFAYFAVATARIGALSFSTAPALNFLAQTLTFMVVFAPVLWWAERRTGALGTVFRLIFRRSEGRLA